MTNIAPFSFQVLDVDGDKVRINTTGQLEVVTHNSLVPEKYDTIELGYTGDNLTGAVYKLDGSTVATLALTYNGDKLSTVTKS